MSEKKTGKYFKYAIGEIVLVVFGILIALQINNWNQDRNRLKLENIILEQLKNELLSISSDINGDYHILKLGQESHYKILDYIENDVPYNDSMCFDFYLIHKDEYIYPKVAVYNRINEKGLDIIRNDSIRYMTQSVYESIFPRISRDNSFYPDLSAFFNDYYLENFKPNQDYSLQFSSNVPSDTLGGRIFPNRDIIYPRERTRNGKKRKVTIGYVPLDFTALKKDTKFHMLLEKSRVFRDYKIGRYRGAKSRVRQLIELIDIELTH
jgi:hypothetical protein